MCSEHLVVKYDETGDPIFSEYKLGVWSAWTRVRDDRICQLCLNNVEDKSTYLQAHHIFPKHQYPELAYVFSNAISLCVRCHLRVTHSDERNVRRFRFMFYSHLNNGTNRGYNSRFQYKVGKLYLPDSDTLFAMDISNGWKALFFESISSVV